MTEIPDPFRTSLYDYELPEVLVAQEPAPRRDAARLLVVDRSRPVEGGFEDRGIPDLTGLLRPGDLLVVNDTRVVPARLFGERRATGGRAEILLLREVGDGWEVLLRTRGRPLPGEEFRFAGGALRVTIRSPGERGVFQAMIEPGGEELTRLLDEHGRLPLPPYIHRSREADPRDALDRERYQTVFATQPGAVAAPTAGLHLNPEILEAVRAAGVEVTAVTLHVGLGTFRPVESPDLREHPMHEEHWEISEDCAAALARCRARGGRIVPVGTTVVRVLESAADDQGAVVPGHGRTRLFIHEPYRFRCVDALLTNFHAPRSTLLMLVAALAGRERILAAYHHARAEGYRFLSYGDAMFIA